MAKLTAEEFAEKHARRLKGAVEDIRKGIERVTVAPTTKAAAKKDKMKARLVEKIDDGTWAKRLQSVTLEEWRAKARDVGVSRIAGGIDANRDKVVAFANQLLPAIDAATSKVASMPDITLEDSIARMTTFIREMSKFRKK